MSNTGLPAAWRVQVPRVRRMARGVLLACGVAATWWILGSPGWPALSGPPAAPGPAAAAAVVEAPQAPTAGAGPLERYSIVPGQSRALYRARELFLRFQRPNVAVGTSTAVTGVIVVDRQRFSRSRPELVRVDLRQLTSDEPRRDEAIRERWLESNRYPWASFRAVGVHGLPDEVVEGEPLAVTVDGELTVRDVTRRVRFQGSLVLQGEELRASAATRVRMSDFGFEPPSILGLLRVDDEVELQVELVARREP